AWISAGTRSVFLHSPSAYNGNTMELKTQKILIALLGLLLTVTIGFAGFREHEISETYRKGKDIARLPRPLTATELKGQKIFHERQCNVCHGVNGSGGVANFNSQTAGGKITEL